MDVVDHLLNRGEFDGIAIVSASWLPESTACTFPFANRDFRQPFGRLFFQITNCLSRDGLLDGPGHASHFQSGFAWIKKQVNVIGHNHIGP